VARGLNMKIDAERVERFCTTALLALGTMADDAHVVAKHLVDADLRGVRSHGLLRLIKYVEQIDSGYISNRAEIQTAQIAPNLMRSDAHMNFGIIAFHRLIPDIIALARSTGIAGGAVVNCAHTGRIGAYSEAIAREFMWGSVFGGGGNKRLKEVAPYGGRKGVFDTNPYAFSMPLDTQQTTTSDFATSATAQGKLLVFRTNHAPVPDGWLIDKHGRPTTNVDDFYEGGAMLPSAGTKGYGMGFMAELFGDAVLGTPHELNWFIVAVDLKRFVDPGDYFQAANHLKQEIEQCPPADGFERVMWPGQPEIERLEHQSAEGIDYSEDELRSLAGLEARFSMKLN
ncbi:MAG: Ldh family oxidoreductase, partial [Hyphomicrobium sp.]|nr:Ldh family oxidoreductase [Hyphomicrobium sp.]